MFENTFNSELRERIQIDAQSFKDTMISDMDFIKKYMLETVLHQQEIQKLLTEKKLLQTQEVQSNTIQALNVDLVFMEKNLLWERKQTESKVQDESSRSGNDTDTDDAYILPIYNEEPMAEVAAEDTDLQKALEESMKIAYALPREVPGKGKAKVTEEQVAHDLLSLQKYKKISPADQYIFQRRVSEPTGSSEHDESPYALIGQSDSEEEPEKVVLGADEGGQDEGQAGPDPGAQAEDQTGSDAGAQDEGQAGSNPDETSEGQAGPDPGDAGAKVQENLKLTVKEQALLEDPASSSGTLSSLQHLSKDTSFGDLFFSDRPSDADKNAETEVESMVNVPIQQAMSSISLMTSLIIDLTSRPESPKRIGELEHIMANLIQVNKDMEERLDKHRARLYTLEQLDIPQQVSIASHKDHMQLFEALEKSMNRDHSEELVQDLAEARKKKKKSRESPKMPPGSPSHQPPPPPPPAGPSEASRALGASGSSHVPPSPPPPSSTNQESSSKGSAAPSSSKTYTSAEYQAWTTTDIRLRPSISLTLADLEIDEDMDPDEQAQSSDDEDIGSAHILTTGDIAIFMDWFCKRRGITELKPQDLEGPAYEIIKVFHPDVIHLQYQMEECHKLLTDNVDDPILRHNVSKPLPLGGPPGQVTIQSHFFFNKDLEYLRYGSKGRRPALSISKMKAAYYSDAGLEQMECKYDIAAMYGISHWWFQRQQFYIDRHTSEGDRRAVRTHMRILSVVRIEVFSMYGYDYMKNIVLRRADLNEHVIAERDFMAVIFQDKYGVQMMMRFNEIHKFSDGTLQQIDEALDYRVKEFRINRMNLGLNRFWTKKDVDRCKAFMFTIQRRLRTRRIFRNLESFVGGRVREGDYRLLKCTE
nr:hypothetical protein [Tanacetum cinerariifolium]